MSSNGRAPLHLASWGLSLAIGLASTAVFGAGILRDTHFGQAELPIDLGRSGPPVAETFRVWGGGDYVLWLTTLGPQPPFDAARAATDTASSNGPDDRAFEGRIEIHVLGPDSRVRGSWSFDGSGAAHVAGEGMSWTRLGQATLRDLPLRAWRIEARTLEGTEAFADAPFSSRILFRPDRPDPGMGGLVNYAMIVPAALFLLLALGLALLYGRRTGRWWAAGISGLSLLSLLAMFSVG